MRASRETWNRPGMIYLHPIRSVIVNDFLADNIARAEQRMMRQGLKRQREKQQKKHDTQTGTGLLTPIQKTNIPLVVKSNYCLEPIEARRQSVHVHKEVIRRILTRGVKLSGAWFVLTVSRVRVGIRETGLRFVAQHVPSSSSSPSSPSSPSSQIYSSTCVMRMSWSALTKALQEMGRTSLAERCLHCVSFPSPEFEIQARSFACAAFLMRRVDVETRKNGGCDLILHRPQPIQIDTNIELHDQDQAYVNDTNMVHDSVPFSSATSSSLFLTATEEEDEETTHFSNNRPEDEKPYYPSS